MIADEFAEALSRLVGEAANSGLEVPEMVEVLEDRLARQCGSAWRSSTGR